MSFAPKTRLGPYEIVAPLGAGGMGEVYRAKDTRLGREVAVKVLNVRRVGDANALSRLEQEARTLAALNHPNLLSVYDIGAAPDGQPYIVSELLEGASLRQRLSEGALPQSKAVEIAVQMARGLAAAHEKGIVHRDLKPDNIFIAPDGRVKILDFGLAKLAGDAAGDAATQMGEGTAPGAVLGTVGYMAPEQVRGQAADHRSDIFSLGAVLYEMLGGRRAFAGDSAVEVMNAILKEDPEPLGPVTGGKGVVSPALDRIARHCLEKEPRQRFQSADDIAFHLGDVSQTSVTSVGAFPPLGGGGKRRWMFAAAGTVGLAAAVALTWWLSRGDNFAAPGFQRVTYQQGVIHSARFLPDGQGVIGVASWNNQPAVLFTGRLDAPGIEVLPAKVNNVLAVAHGEVAVMQDLKNVFDYTNVGTLATMPLSGGAPRPLLDNVEFADYAPGTSQLAITRRHPEATTFTLEYPIGHVLFTTSGWIGDPRFSPDGKVIAFVEHPKIGDDLGKVAIVDLSGRVRELSRQYASAQGLTWAPSGKEIWYTAADTTRIVVHGIDLSGHDVVRLEAPEALHIYDATPDGHVLVASGGQRLSQSIVTPGHPLPLDLTVLDWANNSVLSPDGKQVLVGDEDAGVNYATFLRSAEGSPPIRLGDGDPIALSPDGQWAASVTPLNDQIMLLPTGAGSPRQLTHGEIEFLPFPSGWLPDGHSLIAAGFAHGHRERTYQVSLSGSARAVTPEGTPLGALLTPDGTAVLVRDAQFKFWLYPLAGGPPKPVAGLVQGDRPARFAADGHSVFVSHPMRPGTEIWRVDIANGQRQKLVTVGPDASAGVTNLYVGGISADGKTYIIGSSHTLNTLFVVSGLR